VKITFSGEIHVQGDTPDSWEHVVRLAVLKLNDASNLLAAAVAANSGSTFTPHHSLGESDMAAPVLTDLATAVSNITTVAASATALINGIAARVQAAVDAAIAGGATAAELAPVQAEVDALNSNATSLAAAVSANTPAQAKKP
jgi:hypothetical protein